MKVPTIRMPLTILSVSRLFQSAAERPRFVHLDVIHAVMALRVELRLRINVRTVQSAVILSVHPEPSVAIPAPVLVPFQASPLVVGSLKTQLAITMVLVETTVFVATNLSVVRSSACRVVTLA